MSKSFLVKVEPTMFIRVFAKNEDRAKAMVNKQFEQARRAIKREMPWVVVEKNPLVRSYPVPEGFGE